jgi:uncharacterized membrane protein YraQ (UPF0718 family)
MTEDTVRTGDGLSAGLSFWFAPWQNRKWGFAKMLSFMKKYWLVIVALMVVLLLLPYLVGTVMELYWQADPPTGSKLKV